MTEPERLRRRLEQERELLLQAHPTAILKTDTLVVILPGHPLPAGWSHTSTDVLFAIPANYPGGQPDNICARPDLALVSGAPPGSSQGIQTHDGRSWMQFSWHLDSGDWRPRADTVGGSNLTDYLSGALTRFDDAS